MQNKELQHKCEKGSIKLHPYDTSAERSEAHVPKGSNFIAPQAPYQQQLYVLLVYFILLLNYGTIFDTSA